MNIAKTSKPEIGLSDWQKFIPILLDHPIQTSLFIISFAFLLLVDAPILLSILLLSALVYFIFDFGGQLPRAAERSKTHPNAAVERAAAASSVVADSVEPPKRSTRRVAQSASSPQEPQTKPRRTRRRAGKS